MRNTRKASDRMWSSYTKYGRFIELCVQAEKRISEKVTTNITLHDMANEDGYNLLLDVFNNTDYIKWLEDKERNIIKQNK